MELTDRIEEYLEKSRSVTTAGDALFKECLEALLQPAVRYWRIATAQYCPGDGTALFRTLDGRVVATRQHGRDTCSGSIGSSVSSRWIEITQEEYESPPVPISWKRITEMEYNRVKAQYQDRYPEVRYVRYYTDYGLYIQFAKLVNGKPVEVHGTDVQQGLRQVPVQEYADSAVWLRLTEHEYHDQVRDWKTKKLESLTVTL